MNKYLTSVQESAWLNKWLYFSGHIPQKKDDYKKKLRALAATYVTFSPDGTELLVNLGGEQIYLFDVNRKRRMQKFDTAMVLSTNGFVKGKRYCQQMVLSKVRDRMGIMLHVYGFSEKNNISFQKNPPPPKKKQ